MTKFKKIEQNVPDLNRTYVSGNINYSKAATKNGNIAIIKAINNSYINSIEKWGDVFEIDSEIIISFIATESGGKNTKPNKYFATGLMQVTPNAVAECLPKFKTVTGQAIPTDAANFLNKKGSFLLQLQRDVPLSSTNKTKILNLLETDSEFNIMIGAMYLRFLLQMFSDANNAFLNKAMIAYNAGAYNATLRSYGKVAVKSDTLVNNKSLPLESRSYVLKMLGVDGFLDLIIQQKVI